MHDRSNQEKVFYHLLLKRKLNNFQLSEDERPDSALPPSSPRRRVSSFTSLYSDRSNRSTQSLRSDANASRESLQTENEEKKAQVPNSTVHTGKAKADGSRWT